MQLMCLNGWGGRLAEQLIPYIAIPDPDVLCLQEVVHTPDTQKKWLTYKDHGIELPQRANVFTDICHALPNHTSMFCPAAQGDLWDGENRYGSQWGLATFIRRSIPIVAQKQGFVHGYFSARGYGAHPRSRSAHALRLFDLSKDHPVVIAHMHGLRDPAGKHDTEARLLQAERLVALAQSVAEEGDRMIVCGDFNVLPDSRTFKTLGKLDLADLVIAGGFTDTRTSYYEKEGRYADYMLVNELVQVESFNVVQRPEVSDHRPLILHFS